MGYPKQVYKNYQAKTVLNETQERHAIAEGWSDQVEKQEPKKEEVKKELPKTKRKKKVTDEADSTKDS